MLRLESLNLKEICACKTPPQIGVKYVAGSVKSRARMESKSTPPLGESEGSFALSYPLSRA